MVRVFLVEIKNKMKKTILFLALAVIGGLSFVYVEDTKANKSGTRIIHFPKDRSMGLVHVGELRTLDPLWWQGWEAIGEAKGDVRVPINKAVRLDISTEASEDISPLAALGPDDIQALSFNWNRCNIDDSDLQHLSGLTGLKHLGLSSTQIKGPGLVHLSGLKSLEALLLGRTEISDDSLKHVARLKSLKRLDLGSTKVTDAGLVHLRNFLRNSYSLDKNILLIINDADRLKFELFTELSLLSDIELRDYARFHQVLDQT